jgi:hypothetical protein
LVGSSLGRIIIWGLGLLFALPILASFALFGLGVSSQLWIGAVLLKAFGMVDTTPAKKEWNVVNVRNDNDLADAYRTLVEPENFHSARIIWVEALHSSSELAAGRAAFPGIDAESAAKLHAPQFAIEECGRIKQILAKDCIVEGTEVRAIGTGHFVVSARMTFIVKEEFGIVPAQTPLSFVEIEQNLADGPALISRSQQADVRMEMYRRAVTGCQQARSTFGNCAIRMIRVQSISDLANVSTLRLRGRGTLSVLQKQ